MKEVPYQVAGGWKRLDGQLCLATFFNTSWSILSGSKMKKHITQVRTEQDSEVSAGACRPLTENRNPLNRRPSTLQ